MSKLSVMTYTDLLLYLEDRYSEFCRMSQYLNERGTATRDTYSLILDKAQFCYSKEELIKDLNRVIDKFAEDNAIIKNLKNFIKQLG